MGDCLPSPLFLIFGRILIGYAIIQYSTLPVVCVRTYTLVNQREGCEDGHVQVDNTVLKEELDFQVCFPYLFILHLLSYWCSRVNLVRT